MVASSSKSSSSVDGAPLLFRSTARRYPLDLVDFASGVSRVRMREIDDFGSGTSAGVARRRRRRQGPVRHGWRPSCLRRRGKASDPFCAELPHACGWHPAAEARRPRPPRATIPCTAAVWSAHATSSSIVVERWWMTGSAAIRGRHTTWLRRPRGYRLLGLNEDLAVARPLADPPCRAFHHFDHLCRRCIRWSSSLEARTWASPGVGHDPNGLVETRVRRSSSAIAASSSSSPPWRIA